MRAAANRNDIVLLDPTLDAVAQRGLLADIGTLHLDRSYDYPGHYICTKCVTRLWIRVMVVVDDRKRKGTT